MKWVDEQPYTSPMLCVFFFLQESCVRVRNNCLNYISPPPLAKGFMTQSRAVIIIAWISFLKT